MIAQLTLLALQPHADSLSPLVELLVTPHTVWQGEADTERTQVAHHATSVVHLVGDRPDQLAQVGLGLALLQDSWSHNKEAAGRGRQ